MERQQEANEQYQAGMREVGSRIDAEKSRGVHPPRTVAEEVEQMTSEAPGVGHRLRDPVKAARMQSQEHDDSGTGAAPLATTQRANQHDVDVDSEEEAPVDIETRQRFGSDVRSGPSRNEGS